MSDTASAPARKITGLAPRREAPPLARLVKSERDRAPEPAAVAPPAVVQSEPAVVSAPPPRAVPASAAADDAKVPVTLRWSKGLRQRSRATYLATRSAERDETYSDMVEKAVETELRRREAVYNGGQPFAGGEAQLPTGRPLIG